LDPHQRQNYCEACTSTSGKCRTGCCERTGLKTPPESQNEDKSKTQDDDQSVIPDVTPETEEPEPSSGEAAKTISLIDEADENTAPIPESYRRLETVYGGTIPDDDGTHLHGGIPDDLFWQGYHRRLVTLAPQLYAWQERQR
jgi:hypothetical protein